MDNIAQSSTPQSTPAQPPTTTKPRRLLWIIPLPAKQSKTTAIAKTATTTTATNAEPTFYDNAIEWTHRADKVINLALGYLLAVASVLGFMDVLSNGEVLAHVPAAFYIWLAVMGLGVDFQIFLVIGRFPDLTRQLNGWPRFTFIVFNLAFLAFLCYMSATIGAVFTQHRDVANSTIVTAMQSLHIDATQFVYERAALATALLVLMAIDRTMERWRMQVSHDQQVGNAQTVLTNAEIAAQISETVRNEVQGIAQSLMAELRNEAHLFAQTAQPHTEVNEIAQGTAQPAIAQHSTAHKVSEDETPIAQRATMPELHIVRNEQPAQSDEDGDLHSRVFALLDAQGGTAKVSNNDVVVALQCTVDQARRLRTEYNKAARGGAQ